MKLTDRHRQFIVTRLASFFSPSEVQKELEEVLGLRLETGQIVLGLTQLRDFGSVKE